MILYSILASLSTLCLWWQCLSLETLYTPKLLVVGLWMLLLLFFIAGLSYSLLAPLFLVVDLCFLFLLTLGFLIRVIFTRSGVSDLLCAFLSIVVFRPAFTAVFLEWDLLSCVFVLDFKLKLDSLKYSICVGSLGFDIYLDLVYYFFWWAGFLRSVLCLLFSNISTWFWITIGLVLIGFGWILLGNGVPFFVWLNCCTLDIGVNLCLLEVLSRFSVGIRF